MTSDWGTAKVSDITSRDKYGTASGPFGSNLVSADYVDEGVPVIRGQNMGLGRWIAGDFVYVTEAKAGKLAANKARPGDIVFTQRGTLGQVAIVPASGPAEYVISQSQMKLTVDASRADALFVYYCFTTAEQQEYIRRNAIQTGVPHTNLAHLRGTPLRLPPLPEQRAIAGVLGALDDKIELNRRMNETLEEIARALFKSWFVDFDPVRAKSEGRQPWGMDAETAALFPSEFEESELGEIPKGWRVGTLTDEFDVRIGKTPPRNEHEWFSTNPSDVPWMSIRDLGSSGVFIGETSEFLTEAAVERFRVKRIPEETVVVSFKLTVGRVAITDTVMLSNEAIAHLLARPESSLSREFAYSYLKQFNYDTLGSTSSIATAVNSDSIRSIPTLVPGGEVVRAFTDQVRPLFERIRLGQHESRTLAELRDTLLPKLMSGEVRVRDAERAVEAVG